MKPSVSAGLRMTMNIPSSNSIEKKVSSSVICLKHNCIPGKIVGCVEDGIANGCDMVKNYSPSHMLLYFTQT